MLSITDVSFHYRDVTALSRVTFDFELGVSVLLGRNGAGKTTLLRILAGAVTPRQGEVQLRGKPSGRRSPLERAALREIGWLPQDFGFPPHMSTAQFVGYAAWLKEVDRAFIAQRVDSALRHVDLVDLADRPLRTLSGGQLRRAGLAAALAADPSVLVLDEPTAGLDPEQRESFHRLILDLREKKVVIVATHLLEDVEALADRIVVIDGGKVRWTGTAEDLARAGGGPDAGLAGLRRGFHAVIASSS